MRIRVNDRCNVVTDEHSNAYRSPSGKPPAVQITIPMWAKRLEIWEAEALVSSLAEAIAEAKKQEQQQEAAYAARERDV